MFVKLNLMSYEWFIICHYTSPEIPIRKVINHIINLSTEKTPHQKLSNFSVNNVSAVNITHLATDNLNKVAIACDELNQQAGSNKAIPHVAARNIKDEKELEVFLKFCK